MLTYESDRNKVKAVKVTVISFKNKLARWKDSFNSLAFPFLLILG